MSPKIKAHLISFINTFLAAFLVTFGTAFADIDITNTEAVTMVVASSAIAWVRAVQKLLIEKINTK